jgi:hypothetical protein
MTTTTHKEEKSGIQAAKRLVPAFFGIFVAVALGASFGVVVKASPEKADKLFTAAKVLRPFVISAITAGWGALAYIVKVHVMENDMVHLKDSVKTEANNDGVQVRRVDRITAHVAKLQADADTNADKYNLWAQQSYNLTAGLHFTLGIVCIPAAVGTICPLVTLLQHTN